LVDDIGTFLVVTLATWLAINVAVVLALTAWGYRHG
jgi:hypothetical protein